MKKFRKIITGLTLITVAALSVTVTGCDKEKEESKQAAADVLEEETQPATEAAVKELPDIETFSPEPMGLLGRAKSVMNINDDVVGYIKIDGTYVDYPVFQYKGKDEEDLEENGNSYYMAKDMYGEYLESGSIFMDYRDIIVPDREKQSNNIVLYGHNMLNGTKFASLHEYRKDDEFYKDHGIIEFNTNYEENKYAVIACFVTSGSLGESAYGEEFDYWNMENMDEKEFENYMRIVNDRTTIHPDIDVAYGDQLITLQTCHMDEDNSRFLVIGRKLRDGETVDDFVKKDNKDKEKSEDESSSDEENENEENGAEE